MEVNVEKSKLPRSEMAEIKGRIVPIEAVAKDIVCITSVNANGKMQVLNHYQDGRELPQPLIEVYDRQ